MDRQPDGGDPSPWLKPPSHGEVRIGIAIGEGADLTPEVRRALDELGRALQAEEVEGYSKPKGHKCGLSVCPSDTTTCPRDSGCPKWSVTCEPYIYGPCRDFQSCSISRR